MSVKYYQKIKHILSPRQNYLYSNLNVPIRDKWSDPNAKFGNFVFPIWLAVGKVNRDVNFSLSSFTTFFSFDVPLQHVKSFVNNKIQFLSNQKYNWHNITR